MYKNKIVFSAFTLPGVVFAMQLREYQRRMREDKEHEVERRGRLLQTAPVDITPKNGGSFAWT